MLIAIAAMGLNREIGQNGKLPWEDEPHKGLYRDDMIHFAKETKDGGNGHPCIMGSKTWTSIDEKYKPLVDRPNIVVTSQPAQAFRLPQEVLRASSISAAVMTAERMPHNEKIFLCGGMSLYKWAVDNADELWLTEIPEKFPNADAFFPEFLSKGWKEYSRISSPNNQCEFVRYAK